MSHINNEEDKKIEEIFSELESMDISKLCDEDFRKYFPVEVDDEDSEASYRFTNLLGWSALEYTFYYKSINDITMLLQNKEYDVINFVSKWGGSILDFVLDRQDVEVLKYTMSLGFDINCILYRGDTPLQKAASRHSHECVQLLIDMGADVNAKGVWNRNALHYAAEGERVPPEPKAYKYPEIVKVLINAGVDINHQDEDGMTPLMLICADRGWSYSNILKLLLDAGADTSLVDTDGNNAMIHAVKNNSQDIDILLEYGMKLE